MEKKKKNTENENRKWHATEAPECQRNRKYVLHPIAAMVWGMAGHGMAWHGMFCKQYCMTMRVQVLVLTI